MANTPGTKSQVRRASTHLDESFASTYASYLKKTNREYDDAEVKEFPGTFFYNLHRQEWATHKLSSDRLLSYLNRPSEEGEVFKLLEIGCGNGWLSGKIADLPQFEVTGLDVHLPLLEQASRVHGRSNLTFVQGDLFEDIFAEAHFDIIVLFDTISFFPHFQQLINRCRQYLKKGGEIHILGSHFYPEKELEAAGDSNRADFTLAGVPEMAEHFFQHSKAVLAPFDFQFLYRPGGIGKLFGKKDSPFPWVKIVN